MVSSPDVARLLTLHWLLIFSMRSSYSPARVLLWTGLLSLTPTVLVGQGTTLVSVLDPAYDDLDALVAVGLVQEIIVTQRPYSRMSFARFVAEARGRLDDDRAAKPARPRFAEAIERLADRFSEELATLCGAESGACPALESAVALRHVSLDGAWADSPSRSVPTSYMPISAIDADLNSLLQSNEGRVLVDGQTGGLEALFEAQLGYHLAAQFMPRVWLANPSSASTDGDAAVQTLSLRGVLGNFALEVGRSHTFHGQGRSAGPILSANARALDMVRLHNERPFRLPGFLGLLGPMSASMYVANTASDRHIPNAKLFVMELSARPSRYVELGWTLLNMQGGEGGPEATFGERMKDAFLWFFSVHDRLEISDKVAALDARITLPGQGLEFYIEGATTDINLKRWETLWDEAAWIVGLQASGVGPGGRTDLWIEGHRGGVRPHTHHQYFSGLTIDRRIIGDPMGPMSLNWSAGLEWNGPDQIISVYGAWERYSGDIYRSNGLGDTEFRWDKISDEPDEIRIRGVAEWRHRPNRFGLTVAVRAGYEHVTRFDFTDESRSNLLGQLTIGYSW